MFQPIKRGPKMVLAIVSILSLAYCQSPPSSQADQEVEARKASVSSTCGDSLDIPLPTNCREIEVFHPFEGLKNFREFAYSSQEPPLATPGKLYRSDALHALTEEDIAKMTEMGIRTIVDFRSAEEMEQYPDRVIPGTQTIHLPIGRNPSEVKELLPPEMISEIRALFIAGNVEAVDSLLESAHIDIAAARIERYQEFVTEFVKPYGEFMRILADTAHYPVLYHCQGGKDRTGFAGAMVLGALGYGDSEIIRDYLTTNLYQAQDLQAQWEKSSQKLRPAIGAHEAQMMAALHTVQTQYGSFNQYLVEGLGLTEVEIRQIREALLPVQ
ncbi:tyrosine-protein phosphatase [Pontibacter sp. G13]|uniref:tyrosine-protein phosphatase n=1 Tax=Pontibacter sp. G13 TaxID=3074898 RepID=UPI00288B0037|nr:tyrosine-protein phosphatase [Pontibacter sp. G13]WNJ18461.1 tyrosine-protein phosphatase [Pontibacter sp. G13]